MNAKIIQRKNIIACEYGVEFATFSRHANEDGLQSVTFSIDITAEAADVLENSGIVEVVQWRADGLIIIKRKAFYEAEKLSELLIYILQKHYEKNN